jgi:hypothetical protein
MMRTGLPAAEKDFLIFTMRYVTVILLTQKRGMKRSPISIHGSGIFCWNETFWNINIYINQG